MIYLFFIHIVSHKHLIIVESHEEGDDDEGEDDEDDEGDEAEEAGEENDRPYNLRQRKTVQRYEAPPIGNFWRTTLYILTSIPISIFLIMCVHL